jgi:hypothetical protein
VCVIQHAGKTRVDAIDVVAAIQIIVHKYPPVASNNILAALHEAQLFLVQRVRVVADDPAMKRIVLSVRGPRNVEAEWALSGVKVVSVRLAPLRARSL